MGLANWFKLLFLLLTSFSVQDYCQAKHGFIEAPIVEEDDTEEDENEKSKVVLYGKGKMF